MDLGTGLSLLGASAVVTAGIMRVPLPPILNRNGKYVKDEVCKSRHSELDKRLERIETTICTANERLSRLAEDVAFIKGRYEAEDK